MLDIGCGSGTLAKTIMPFRPDVTIEGIDVLVRPTPNPGHRVRRRHHPLADGHFDIALFVDVLHHTEAPAGLLAEAKRVSKDGIVIKDHFRDGIPPNATLRFMDWVGNALHGVVLPYNYLSDPEWRSIWSKLGLKVEAPDRPARPLPGAVQLAVRPQAALRRPPVVSMAGRRRSSRRRPRRARGQSFARPDGLASGSAGCSSMASPPALRGDGHFLDQSRAISGSISRLFAR